MTKSGQKEHIFKSLHIDSSYKNPKFNEYSPEVAKGYAADSLINFSVYYQYLVDHNLPLIVMAGEFDMQDGAATQ